MNFDGFFGQDKITRELYGISQVLNKNPEESINILLRGSAGCGKTLLAKLFCKSLNNDYSIQIPTRGFIWSNKLKNVRCHIVDEIHTLKVYEDLYPLMDSGKYVFIFTTTESGELIDPFINRCIIYTFSEYNVQALTNMIMDYSKKLKFMMSEDTAKIIAERSKGVPRNAKLYLKRIKFIIDQGYHTYTLNGINNAFIDIGVYDGGYTDLDMKYLKFLAGVGKASLNTICQIIGIDKKSATNDIEPFLIKRGHIKITSKGRQFLGWQQQNLI